MSRWPIRKVGALVTVRGGGTPKRDVDSYFQGHIPWVTPKDMKSWEIADAQIRITDEAVANSAANMVPPGSVLLVVRSGVLKHTAPVAVSRVPVAINQDMKALICGQDVLPEYLARFLKHQEPEILSWVRATTADNYPIDKLKDLEIPLPPLDEQRRIAAILDQADALRRKRREAIEKQSALLASAFETIVGEPSKNPMGWAVTTMEEVASLITDGEHQTPRRTESGIKLLSARNIQMGYLDFSDVDFVDDIEFKRISKRCAPVRGDVLISCSGSIGRVSVVNVDEPLALVRSAALVRPNAKVMPEYLEAYLRTPAMQQAMRRAANASGQPNLFQGPIRKLDVLVPNIAVQARVAKVAGAIKQGLMHQARHLQSLNDLQSSLQHRAFNGEL